MVRTPPRFPRTANDQRAFLNPPLAGITAPIFGWSSSAICNWRYSSSESSARTWRVKLDVSMKINEILFFKDYCTPMAYNSQVKISCPRLEPLVRTYISGVLCIPVYDSVRTMRVKGKVYPSKSSIVIMQSVFLIILKSKRTRIAP